MTEHYTRQPTVDADLQWLFHEAEAAMGFRSGFGVVANQGELGVRVSSPMSCDARITERLVGSPGNSAGRKEGAAGRQSRLMGYLRRLPGDDGQTLWLAYGPACKDAQWVNKTKSAWPLVMLVTPAATGAYLKEAPTRKCKDRKHFAPEPRASVDYDKQTPAKDFKGDLRLLPWKDADPEVVPFVEWLTQKAPKAVLTAAETEAAQMVRNAWNRWADVRGRRRKRIAVRAAETDEELGPMVM